MELGTAMALSWAVIVSNAVAVHTAANFDVVVYGSTPAGIAAATAAGVRCHLYTGAYAIAGDAPLQTRDPAAAIRTDLAAMHNPDSHRLAATG